MRVARVGVGSPRKWTKYGSFGIRQEAQNVSFITNN